MNHYLKLVNFEINRFIKIYVTLIAITIISQITGVIVISKGYLNDANKAIYEESISQTDFILEYGTMGFNRITQSAWVMGSIALCIVALLFYIFLIWYRDWFGKNTFIYRLLMLPTDRLNVYLAKATTIFLMVLGLTSLQIILLPIENRVMQWLVPLDFRADMNFDELIGTFNYLTILFPSSFIEFLIHYGIGFMVVFIVFTGILFERSFRWKGIILGGVYCLFAIGIFLIPAILTIVLEKAFLYPIEYFVLQVILGFVVIGMSLWVARYLLNKRITL